MRTHPYAEAICEVDARGFSVKISISDTNPATVSSFNTEAARPGSFRAKAAYRPNPNSAGFSEIQTYGRRIGGPHAQTQLSPLSAPGETE